MKHFLLKFRTNNLPYSIKPELKIIIKYLTESNLTPSKFIISSFRWDELKKFRNINKDVPIAILVDSLYKIDNAIKLAKEINAVALKDALDKNGIQTRVQSAITMTAVAEPYIRLRAIRHLEKGRVVIFAAGTGNPYFTTDTAASLRAAEIDANLMLKSTRVDGVFDEDPEKNNNAEKYDEISYKEVVSRKLKVMDLTAITLCEENEMPIRVFDGTIPGNIYNALTGESIGTLIK